MRTRRDAYNEAQELQGVKTSLTFFKNLDRAIEQSEYEKIIELMTPFYEKTKIKFTIEELSNNGSNTNHYQFDKLNRKIIRTN